MDVADLVEAEQVQAGVAADDAGELFVVGGLDEFVDQGGGGDVADPAAGLGGGGAQPDEQVGLAGAGVPEQHHRFAGVDPGAGGEVREGGRGQRRVGVQVEVGQPLGAGELGLVDPPDAASGVAVVALGGEDLGEVGLVGQPFPGRGRRRCGRPRRGWWAGAARGRRRRSRPRRQGRSARSPTAAPAPVAPWRFGGGHAVAFPVRSSSSSRSSRRSSS